MVLLIQSESLHFLKALSCECEIIALQEKMSKNKGKHQWTNVLASLSRCAAEEGKSAHSHLNLNMAK